MIGKPARKIIQQLQLYQIYPAYISKIKSNCEKQVIILMIPIHEKEGWHYLTLKKLRILLRIMTLKH